MLSIVVSRWPVVAFFALTYLISWSVSFVMIALSLRIDSPGAGIPIFLVGVVSAPTLSAIILTWISSGAAGVRALLGRARIWRVGPGWYLFVLLIYPAAMLLAMALSALAGRLVPDFSQLQPWLQVVPLFIVVLLVGGAVNEEFGWRGYALPRLQAKRNAFTASLIIGVLWGLWHLPNWWLPGTGQYVQVQGNANYGFFIVQFILGTTALSVLYTWVYNNTRGSLLMPLLFHASVGTASGWLSRAVNPAGAGGPLLFFVLLEALLWVVAIAVTVTVRTTASFARAPVSGGP